MSSGTFESSTGLRDRFEHDGYVILRRFLAPGIIAGARCEVADWVDRQARKLLQEGVNPSLYEDEPFETRAIHVFDRCPDRLDTAIRRDLHVPGMFPLFFHPGLLDLVERLLGPEIRLYPNYSVRPKLPGLKKTEVLWHQDAGYTASGRHGHDPAAGQQSVAALRMVNVWTPLVPATRENGCMQFIPGSHRLGLVPHLPRNEFYLEIEPETLDQWRLLAVDIELEPGDVVLFSNLLFHAGLPNCSRSVRWSCDWRYQDARESTMRSERGHLARSRLHPQDVVASAEQWTRLTFV